MKGWDDSIAEISVFPTEISATGLKNFPHEHSIRLPGRNVFVKIASLRNRVASEAWRSSQLVRERETSARTARSKATPGGRRGEENASRDTNLLDLVETQLCSIGNPRI